MGLTGSTKICATGPARDAKISMLTHRSQTKEKQRFEGRSPPPGNIVFLYGEPQHPKWANHTFDYQPQENYMWMFPAQLRHQVLPFRTEGTRITVSGNLYFNAPGTPDAISAALGVYTGSSEVWLLKVPVPEVLQV